jgi:UrcA family protein
MKTLLTLAAVVAASSFTPALAQDAAGERRHVVHYSDLDLSREADLRKFDRRLARAIAEACGSASDFDPAGKNQVRRCRDRLWAGLTAERERTIASRARPDIVVAARER